MALLVLALLAPPALPVDPRGDALVVDLLVRSALRGGNDRLPPLLAGGAECLELSMAKGTQRMEDGVLPVFQVGEGRVGVAESGERELGGDTPVPVQFAEVADPHLPFKVGAKEG